MSRRCERRPAVPMWGWDILWGARVDELINRNIYSLDVRLGVKFGRLLE
ncbi:hypothetical protein [Flavilitoribacter nigricans]|nr:hypothetical protein [Flavilitoribacter nigricans]